MRALLLSVGLSVAVYSLGQPSAQAQTCGTIRADAGNNDIVIGEAVDETPAFYPDGGVYWTFHRRGYLRACWRDAGGVWRVTDLPGCNYASSANVLIEAQSGDDRLAPAQGSGVHNADYCIGDGISHKWVGEYYFPFGFTARMGWGSDVAYGTLADDRLFSRDPNDSDDYDYSMDYLCGFEGNDTLNGDWDDNSSQQECLFGGADTDLCQGDPFVGGTVYDQHHSCESNSFAASMPAGGGVCSAEYVRCTASAAPNLFTL